VIAVDHEIIHYHDGVAESFGRKITRLSGFHINNCDGRKTYGWIIPPGDANEPNYYVFRVYTLTVDRWNLKGLADTINTYYPRKEPKDE